MWDQKHTHPEESKRINFTQEGQLFAEHLLPKLGDSGPCMHGAQGIGRRTAKCWQSGNESRNVLGSGFDDCPFLVRILAHPSVSG